MRHTIMVMMIGSFALATWACPAKRGVTVEPAPKAAGSDPWAAVPSEEQPVAEPVEEPTPEPSYDDYGSNEEDSGSADAESESPDDWGSDSDYDHDSSEEG